MDKVQVYIEIMENGAVPAYANFNDAGADVFASCDIAIRPMESVVIPLNIRVALPDDIEMQVRPRSGLSLKTDLRIPNSPGTVDAGYRDIVGIIAQNTYNIANLPYEVFSNPSITDVIASEYEILKLNSHIKDHVLTADPAHDHILEAISCISPLIIDKRGNPYGTIYIEKGMKIAQLVFNEYRSAEFIVVDSVASIGTDRGGGFGSTGI
ncbi:aminotransferase [Youngiibacter fragilis 232.1]|uniref:dUTP diphosphatase n=1 Tax=Youngiibacter fragilis 232.1 TaxID=994573 RepID=V7I2G7_9CLOT|nr:aminotransferase [Youngiibacter fragilis 232.1]